MVIPYMEKRKKYQYSLKLNYFIWKRIW